MAAVYKVQNMQLIVDNTIHPAAVFEEDEEATADHHSVAVVDLIVEVCLNIDKKKIFIEYIWGRGGGFEGAYEPGFGPQFETYGPPMVGRPPFGRPPRAFGGPMMRGIKKIEIRVY